MSTYEDRLSSLERKVASIEFERLYEKKQKEELTPSNTSLSAINHNLAMLLGIATGQEGAITSLTDEVSVLRTDTNQRLRNIDQRMEGEFERQGKRMDRLEQRMDGMELHLGSIDQTLKQLVTLISKSEQ